MIEQLKTCRNCEAAKARAEFGREPRLRDGLKADCKSCLAAKQAARRAESRAKDPVRLERAAVEARRSELGLRWCRGCGRELRLSQFAKCAESPDGLDPRCKDCNNDYGRALYARDLERNREKSRQKSRKIRATPTRLEYEREWREKNRNRLRENYRARVEANPQKELEKGRIRRARKKNATIGPVDLDVLWTGFCGICAGPMSRRPRWPAPDSKSIDHIIPLAKGGSHAQDNLQWAHLRCNMAKGDRLDLKEAS